MPTLAGAAAQPGARPRPPRSPSRSSAAFAAALVELGAAVATGRFGAHMTVELVNDGPVTLLLEA